MIRKVYFDNNATTPVHPEVVKAVEPFLKGFFGNPSSLHWAGRDTRGFSDRAREQIAGLINAEPGEIVVTSCGTESDNQAIKGVAYGRRSRGNHIITTTIEHPAVLNSCQYLETQGFNVTYLPVDEYGRIHGEDVAKALREDTILVSVMYANNETGTIMPLKEIGEVTREAGVLLHSDMVQAMGKIHIDVEALNVDLASFSGHKVYAPKGVGALYMKEGLEIDSLLHGGHQEGGRRAGTENVSGLVAFGEVCEIAGNELAEVIARMESLRKRLLEGITGTIDHVRLNGHPVERLPNTLNLTFEFVEAESLLIALDLQGIAVSAGSACSSGSSEPSHVLRAMGIPPGLCQSALRLSLGRESTIEDVDYVLDVFPGVVERMRAMSPLCTR